MKQFLIIAILGCLGWNAQAEGTLRLLNTKFDHPQLRDWAAINTSLLSGLQKGVDLMLLNASGELHLVQSADSLGQAHGFLSFDYRIYGPTTSYTVDNAQSLLPKVQLELQSKFNVNSNVPYVLMISWFEHKTKQADMLLFIQWDGFARLIEYDASRRALIESLTKDAYLFSQATSLSPQQALTATLSKFRILLNPALVGYFVIEGKKYTANDTFFTCQCAQPIKLEAYRSNNLPFTKTGKQKWNNNAKYLFDNIGELDRMKASSNSGAIIQADFTDSVGVQYTATLRVYVVEVDFEDAKGRYGFDENQITQYTTYRIDSNGSFIRWKLIPKFFSDNVLVKITPSSVAHKVYFTTLNNSSILTPQKASSGSQTVTIRVSNIRNDELITHVGSLQGCDYGKLKIWCPDTATVRIKFVVIHEEDDDSQLIKLNQGAPNKPGILAGNNNQIDSPLKQDDQINGLFIDTGKDGILDSKIQADDVPAPNVLQTGNGEKNQLAIAIGNNNFLDTNPARIGGDDAIKLLNGVASGIENGPNGKTETKADSASTKISTNFSSLLNGYTSTTSKVYEKVGIKFISDLSLDQVEVNYDLDYDGLLNKKNDAEYQELMNNYNIKRPGSIIPLGTKQVFVFIVNGYTNQCNAAGDCTDGLSLPRSHTATIPSNVKCGGRSVAHEIGHGIFGLVDNQDIPNFSQGVDPDNLMSYDNCTGIELRAFQWFRIQTAVGGLR